MPAARALQLIIACGCVRLFASVHLLLTAGAPHTRPEAANTSNIIQVLAIVVAVAMVSPCIPFGTTGPCGQCQMEHTVFAATDRHKMLQKGLIRLYCKMPHRVWLPDTYVEKQLSACGANLDAQYGWAKGNVKKFTVRMKKLAKKTADEHLCQQHVFRETSAQGAHMGHATQHWWCLWG